VSDSTMLAFQDARACKKWLAAVPVQNVWTAVQMVYEQLLALQRARFPAMERLKCLEIIREKIVFLYAEVRTKLGSKSLPLSGMDYSHWQLVLRTAESMELGYRTCLNVAEVEGGEITRALAFIWHRMIRFQSLQMALYNATHQQLPDGLNSRLNQAYREAELKNVHRERVRDSLESDDGDSSVQVAYIETVLRQVSELSRLTAQQIEMVEYLSRQAALKVGLVEDTSSLKLPPTLAVELTTDHGALPAANIHGFEGTRYFATEILFRHLRTYRKKLEDGESLEAARLPQNWHRDEAIDLLKLLEKIWCGGGLPRPAVRVPNETNVQLGTGFFEAYLFVAGRPFAPPEGTRRLTSQEERDIAMFGRISTQTHQRLRAMPNVTLDTWGIIDESAGALRLMRPSTANRSVGVARLMVIKVGVNPQFYLATIREIVHERSGMFTVSIAAFPGKPEAVAISAPDRTQNESEEWLPALLLPEIAALKLPDTLVIPVGYANPGRILHCHTSMGFTIKVNQVVERGVDYARVSFLAVE
jgi:cyclic-di-GMP-binding protein